MLWKTIQDYKVRGMDCMKMWPWMRDLPTSVWAGRGWAFDENGLRRLTSTGGSGAMQGVEIFESVGAAAEELKPKDAIVREAASPASHAELPAASVEGAKPNKFRRTNLVKQSGVPGVCWNRTCCAWQIRFPTFDSQGRKTGRVCRMFSVSKFMVNGRSEAEADAAALEAAKAFHAELVRKGILEEPKERDPNFTSDVPGVGWHQKHRKWQVRISLKKSNPKERQKLIQGGLFTEKAAAEAEAWRLQELHGLEREVKAVSTLSALPVFEPKVPYAGVTWSQAEQQWHAQCTIGGVKRHFRVKPKDHSEAELERSFQVAVAWRKRQEKEKEKMAKCKTKLKPEKKRRKCNSQKSWVVNIENFARVALLNFQTARWSQNHVRVPESIQIRHVPFRTIHVFFHVWWGFKFKVADLSPIHFRKLSATDGTKLDLDIGVSPGVWLCIYKPAVDPSKTVSSFKIYRIGLGSWTFGLMLMRTCPLRDSPSYIGNIFSSTLLWGSLSANPV